MTPAEELELRRHVQRTARALGLIRGKGWGKVAELMAEEESTKRRERERLDEPGCSRAFNPAGLR